MIYNFFKKFIFVNLNIGFLLAHFFKRSKHWKIRKIFAWKIFFAKQMECCIHLTHQHINPLLFHHQFHTKSLCLSLKPPLRLLKFDQTLFIVPFHRSYPYSYTSPRHGYGLDQCRPLDHFSHVEVYDMHGLHLFGHAIENCWICREIGEPPMGWYFIYCTWCWLRVLKVSSFM